MKRDEQIERFACKYGNIDYPIPYGYVGAANNFLNGYKAAQSEMYSEEDMINLVAAIMNYQDKTDITLTESY